ncbi:MAG: DUF1775 domain-containing protein [Phenylobacterium sp.]|uniref:DUF1775 domain-containing protein n=1 Tax=Phenylobacterium sp. TaxID=1871053 RepID=UPI0027325724|nr:DUF1775 domain-containing protein [Phenylobacterium sp.]MDP3173367.1 DUF1775 domain-containing protein [Phenylobacterium sp.]
MSLFSRSTWLLAAGAVLAVATVAQAHVTIGPKESPLGVREKYVMRVPNERKTATVKVEGFFPAGLKISSFEDKCGWKVETTRDASGAIVSAVWTGEVPVDGYAEFGIIAINPKEGATLAWKFNQTYADGTVVEWSGPKGSKTPGPIVTLTPAPETAPAPAAAAH